MEMAMKVCIKCGNNFSSRTCERCKAEYQRRYRKINAESIHAKRVAYCKKRFEEIKAQKKIYNSKNKEKISKVRKDYRTKNSEKLNDYYQSDERRNAVYLRLYGITLETYNILFERQNGVCAGCKRPSKNKRLHVDHVHDDTKRVRGLLCNSCNRALGLLVDNIETLKNLTEYIDPNKKDLL